LHKSGKEKEGEKNEKNQKTPESSRKGKKEEEKGKENETEAREEKRSKLIIVFFSTHEHFHRCCVHCPVQKTQVLNSWC
jgi:hypothetical protein